MEKQRKISIVSLLIAILLIVTITIGTSYSLWTTSVQQESTNTIDVGCFRIDFSDEGFTMSGNINLENAYPMPDAVVKGLTPYKFSITNQCSVASSYNVLLETLNASTMDETQLDVKFNDTSKKHYVSNVTEGLSEDAKNGMKLASGYLDAGETITYNLKVWIDYDVTVDTPNIQGKVWNGRVVVNSEATFTKPSFTNKVIGEDNVTLDIDTKNDKTVQTLECFYGNERVQNEVGTAIGTSKCQFPLTAEYAKYKVTYTDGTSDTSYHKQLAEYIVKDGVERYTMENWASTSSFEDGYVKVLFGASVNNASTYFVNDRLFDIEKYYAAYYDMSYSLSIPSNTMGSFSVMNIDNGYYDGTQVEYMIGKYFYYGTNTSPVNQNVSRQQFKVVYDSSNNYKLTSESITPAPEEFDYDNFRRTVLSFALSFPDSTASAELDLYNWYFQLAE
ncbi:MAG: hypothetical protein E7159_04540 [Firmicutes bacterium]|nr:hypothetical protein [Bacillota bacterium]